MSTEYPTAFLFISIAGTIMHFIVRPCEMALIKKIHEAWFASVTNASLLDVSFFCLLFNVARLCSYKSGEKHETSVHFFAHEK